MIDAGSLFYSSLVRDLDSSVTVVAELQLDTIDNFPTVSFSWSGAGQTGNGTELWFGFLDLNVFDDVNSAFGNASAVYDLVHAWPNQVAEFGWVESVTDQQMFSPVPSPVVAGRQVVQYAGSFALALRN